MVVELPLYDDSSRSRAYANINDDEYENKRGNNGEGFNSSHILIHGYPEGREKGKERKLERGIKGTDHDGEMEGASEPFRASL